MEKGGEFVINDFYKLSEIEYVNFDHYSNTISEYNKLCEWLDKTLEENINYVKDNDLICFEKTSIKLKGEIHSLKTEVKNMDKYIQLSDIEYKNKYEFEELVRDIYTEYNYLKNKRSKRDDYSYLKGIFSWFKLAPDFVNSSIDNLSHNKVDLSDISLEDISNKNYFNVDDDGLDYCDNKMLVQSCINVLEEEL